MPVKLDIKSKSIAEAMDKVSKVGVHCLFSPDGNNFTRYGKSCQKLLRYVDFNKNWYISLNAFKTWKRRSSNVLGLNAIFIDVDCLKNGVDKGHFYYDFVILSLAKHQLLWPTWITDSGHGFYLVYLFSQQVVNHNPVILRLWSKLERTMVDNLNKHCRQHFGRNLGDIKATDPGRVLRVQDTFNLKSKPIKCQIIAFSPKSQFNMFKLVDAYLPKIKYKSPKKGKIRRFKRFEHQVANNFKDKTPHSLNWARSADLIKWCKLNNNNIKGFREEFLFLYSCAAIRIEGSRATINDVFHLNSLLRDPLPYQEICNLKIEITHDDILKYKFKTSTIIKKLDITPKIQRNLATLISPREKYRRRKLKRHLLSFRHHKDKLRRNNKIIQLHYERLSYRKIAKIMGISKTTVQKIMRKS